MTNAEAAQRVKVCPQSHLQSHCAVNSKNVLSQIDGMMVAVFHGCLPRSGSPTPLPWHKDAVGESPSLTIETPRLSRLASPGALLLRLDFRKLDQVKLASGFRFDRKVKSFSLRSDGNGIHDAALL